MRIDTIDVPLPQRYTPVRKLQTISHVGLNGRIRRDIRSKSPPVVYQVQIGWEGLDEEMRIAVMTAWGYLVGHSSASFIDPTGVTYTARLPRQNREFKWVAYDGPKKTTGEISVLYDISVVVEIY